MSPTATSSSAQSEASKYPPSDFSMKYAKVLAPNGKLVGPDVVFGEGGMFDKDVEEKTKLAFKVTMKKLEKFGQVAEENKDLLKTARIDQIVECFPNTLLKLLPSEIGKSKWTKKAKEVETWEHWWEMHDKVRTAVVYNFEPHWMLLSDKISNILELFPAISITQLINHPCGNNSFYPTTKLIQN